MINMSQLYMLYYFNDKNMVWIFWFENVSIVRQENFKRFWKKKKFNNQIKNGKIYKWHIFIQTLFSESLNLRNYLSFFFSNSIQSHLARITNNNIPMELSKFVLFGYKVPFVLIILGRYLTKIFFRIQINKGNLSGLPLLCLKLNVFSWYSVSYPLLLLTKTIATLQFIMINIFFVNTACTDYSNRVFAKYVYIIKSKSS